MSLLKDVPDNINFPETEKRILEKWRKNDTFQKSLKYFYLKFKI